MKYRKFGIRIYKCMVFALIVCITFYGFAGVYFHKLNSAGVVPVQNKTTWSILASRYKHDGAKVLRIKHDHSIAYNCTKEIAKLSAEKAAQDDPRLIYAIKRCYLEVPSSLPYELENPDRQDYSQGGQSKYVDDLLNHTEDGFFVESGAFDGEYLSNSLFFEIHRHWSGLLIEPVSDVFSTLKRKNRKSFCVNACLNKYTYPSQIHLEVNSKYPEMSKTKDGKGIPNRLAIGRREEAVQCFPFYSILLATGRTRIDLFSLDVEGDEMEVLKTIPWDKVDIKVLIVEYNHLQDGKAGLISFLASKHYRNVPSLRTEGGWQDAVFIKNT